MTVSNNPDVKSKDVRSLRFIFKYIQKHLPHTRSLVFEINNPDTALSNRIINDTLELYLPDAQMRQAFISQMELKLSTTITSEKVFTRLEKDTRATFWLWGSIYSNHECNQLLNKELNINNGTNWYSELRFPTNVPSHRERFGTIIGFVDYVCMETDNPPAVRKWLVERLGFWQKNAMNVTRMKWLDQEDAETCMWAYHSLRKHQDASQKTADHPPYPVQLPSPINPEEAFHTFYAMLDLWGISNEEQQQICKKIDKAFYQKSFRRKQSAKKERKEFSEEHLERLNFLVKYYGADRTTVLERLIDDRINGIKTRADENRIIKK